jgi:hypothetical protein
LWKYNVWFWKPVSVLKNTFHHWVSSWVNDGLICGLRYGRRQQQGEDGGHTLDDGREAAVRCGRQRRLGVQVFYINNIHTCRWWATIPFVDSPHVLIRGWYTQHKQALEDARSQCRLGLHYRTGLYFLVVTLWAPCYLALTSYKAASTYFTGVSVRVFYLRYVNYLAELFCCK